MYTFSKKSIDKLETCHNDLYKIASEAIKNSPYDFGISYGHRTPDEQRDLYLKGRNGNPGKIVTYCDGYLKKSKHNYLPSLAFDFICYINGKLTWEDSVYLEVGLHIMEVAEQLFEDGEIDNMISWGGNWKKFKDLGHIQI